MPCPRGLFCVVGCMSSECFSEISLHRGYFAVSMRLLFLFCLLHVGIVCKNLPTEGGITVVNDDTIWEAVRRCSRICLDIIRIAMKFEASRICANIIRIAMSEVLSILSP